MSQIESSFLFNYVEQKNQGYNTFDMSYSAYFTAKLGKLYTFISEYLPADKVYEKIMHFIRTNPLVAPVMQDIKVETLSFAVPYRICNEYFREQISQGDGKVLSISQQDYTPPSFAFITLPDIINCLALSTTLGTNISRGNDINFMDLFDGFDFHGIPIYNFIDKTCVVRHKEWKKYKETMELGESSVEPWYLVPCNESDGRLVGSANVSAHDFSDNPQARMSLVGYLIYLIRYIDNPSLFFQSIKDDSFHDAQGNIYTSLPTAVKSYFINAHHAISIDYTKTHALRNICNYIHSKIITNLDKWQHISVMPFQATYRVYCDWFRDENFIEMFDDNFKLSGHVNILSGTISQLKFTHPVVMFQLHNSAYQKDYFQAALPKPQALGEVFVPFSARAMETNDELMYAYRNKGKDSLEYLGLNDMTTEPYAASAVPSNYSTHVTQTQTETNALVLSVNNIREAFALQGYLETLNRAGTRYVETIYSMYGVTVPDAVVNRSLYLNKTQDIIKVSDVESNSVTLNNDNSVNTPIGTLGGKALSYSNGDGFEFEFHEFGYIVTFVRIVPNVCYSQGLNKMFTRLDVLDFYNSRFANLGEQPLYKNEIFFRGQEEQSDGVFGFMPRYSELRAAQNQIHGDLNSSLDFWIASRKFNNAPNLSVPFLEVGENDLGNVFAVQDERFDNFICQFYFDTKKASRMAIFDIPATLN